MGRWLHFGASSPLFTRGLTLVIASLLVFQATVQAPASVRGAKRAATASESVTSPRSDPLSPPGVAGSAASTATSSDSRGTDFWLAFPGNLGERAALDDAGEPASRRVDLQSRLQPKLGASTIGSELRLLLTASTAAMGTVAAPGAAPAFSTTFTVTPGIVTSVILPSNLGIDASDTVQDLGIHVTADQEVTVFGFDSEYAGSTDAFLGLPTDVVGLEYIVEGYKNVDVVNGTEFAVVATQDDTTMTVNPSVATNGHPAGTGYTVELNQGQTYQLRNTDSAPADLSGSILTSDKPIAVFAGHECANIPAGFQACNHLVEQMTPTSTWGTSFVTEPFAARSGGDTFRFLAGTDDTTVQVNGIVVATLDRGELFEQIVTTASLVTSNNPILVAQYSNSVTYDNCSVGCDPFEIIVPSLAQFLNTHIVATPGADFGFTNFINVVAPTSSLAGVTLDNVVVPAASFTAIPGSNYSGAQLAVAAGSHTLTGSQPLGVAVYGFGGDDGYGYPGGLSLAATPRGHVCAEEAPASSQQSGHVTIHYDPRFLWSEGDPDYLLKASWIAKAVADRAAATLDSYAALGFAVPAHVDILVKCNPANFDLWFLTTHRDGHVDGPGQFKVKADYLRTHMFGFVEAMARGGNPSMAHTDVADLIDHELVHILQIEQKGVFASAIESFTASDAAVIEGTATLGQDLIADADDDHLDPARFRSFLAVITDFIHDPRPVDYHGDPDGRSPYSVAAFYQYLSEQRAGVTNHLELHVASFIRSLLQGGTHFGAVRYAMGASTEDAVLDALRDFYVTLYVREKANKATLPYRFRILDEITAHDQQAGVGSGVPSWGVLQEPPPGQPPRATATLHTGVPLHLDEQYLGGPAGIGPTDGGVYEINLPAGTTEVRVTLHPLNWGWELLRLGFVPVAPGDLVTIDPRLFQLGPRNGQTQAYDIPVVGMTKLAIAVVNGRYQGDWDMTVETRDGVAAITMDSLPAVVQDDTVPTVQTFVHPSIGGVPSCGLPRVAYSARIDGSFAVVTGAYDLVGRQMLFVKPADMLTFGSHTLEVSYGAASATGTFLVTSGGTLAPADDGVASAAVSTSTTGSLVTVLEVGGAAEAGLPIDVSFILADEGEGLPGATVVATLTDPAGATRQVVLADNGGDLDSGAGDGAYGARIFGTDQVGTWTVRVDASGTARDGLPFSLAETATIVLGAKVDADGDGVADALEAGFGMSPTDPTDGALDLDGDGASVAAELAVGSDPLNPDTDSGGEADGSEMAAGLSPVQSSDDRAVVAAWLSGQPIDGRSIRVQVASADQVTPVHLSRISADGTSVDLGLRAGAGETFVDGPLAAGLYSYEAVVEMASGARAVPASFGPFEARDDATPPTVRILLSDNRPATNTTLIDVTYIDLSEDVTDMRLADSEAGLESVPWQPYAPLTTINVSPTDGPKYVYAQVRDASGLASPVAEGAIVLDTVPPSSTANTIPPYTTATSIDVTYTAVDDRSIGSVELWSRSTIGSWSPWARVDSSTASAGTFMYIFPAPAQFEFETIAVDLAGNREVAPSTADASTIFDPTAPTSAAGALAPTTASASITVPYVASDDVSGVASVALWSRFRATTTAPWGAWALGSTVSQPPMIYVFGLGYGFYEFYTVATDQAGNRETPPVAADAATHWQSGTPPIDTIAPSVPTGLTATVNGTARIDLAWTASTDNVGVRGYKLYRNNAYLSAIGIIGSTAISDTGLAANTTYTYTVSAIDAAGKESAKSVAAVARTAAPDTVAPSVPTSVHATASAWNQVDLSWTASTDNVGVTRYTILRAGVALGVVAGSQTSFTDRTTLPSTAYAYTVKAGDAAGKISAASAAASVTTPVCTCTSVTLRPVSDISAAGFSPNTGTTRYTQLDEPTSDGDTTYIGGGTSGLGTAIFGMGGPAGSAYAVTIHYVARQVTTGATATMNVHAELYNGTALLKTGATHNLPTTYTAYTDTFTLLNVPAATLRVKLVQASASTATITSRFTYLDAVATYFPADTVAPSKPGSLTATANGSARVDLAWTASTDAVAVKGYKLYRNGLYQAAIGIIGSTSISDTGLAGATTYTYKISAIDAAGVESAQSSAAVATTAISTDTVAPSVPTGVGATATAWNSVNLIWTASTDNVGVTRYTILRGGTVIAVVSGSVLSFTDRTTVASTAYSYTVKASDAAGRISAASSPAAVTTPPLS